MPVDDRDDAASDRSPETEKKTVSGALASETDEPLPPVAEAIAERDADRAEPVTPQGQRRRYVTRRNALIATVALAVGFVALILIAVIVYRLGYVDRYLARQIVDTFAQYGIRAEIKEFHTKGLSSTAVEMTGIGLYDSKTGEQIGKIDRLVAQARITDLYALNLRRNINLESLQVDGAEVWVKFDEQGNSNFRNITLPPPDPNRRILFSYSTARVIVNGGVIHYGDERHDISGEARNIAATIQPDDPNAPAESWMNTVTLALSNSTFVYDGRPVNDISVEARGRVNQTRAEIQELVLRSPLAEARLAGTMDDWRNLRYQMQVKSMIDLTQASDILQAGTTLRGVGNLEGTVSGEGSRYQVDGHVTADALAADGIRLQNLNLNARGTGDGSSYDVNGQAVAEVLAAGDFQLNTLQLAGGVIGTGADFRWVGELRAAAARGPGTTIAGLILSDVVAESRDDVLTASAASASAGRLNTSGAAVSGAQASDVRVRSEDGVTTASVGSVRANRVDASGVRVGGVTAGGVEIVSRDGSTVVVAKSVRVGGIDAAGAWGASIGSLNIAGVRLTVRDGRVEGRSGDINAGTVAFKDGRVENLRLARPVFVIEPQGRYRASADLSLGGGVLGKINLGAARSSVVATNNQIRLDNFTADVLNGNARGNATISTARGGASRVAAEFNGLDIDNLIATFSQRIVPLTGKTSGAIDLAFPGSNIKAASGTVRAEFSGETGDEVRGRTPLTGTVDLRAERGLFNIERANLRTASSELTATGRFSFVRAESDLQLNVASSNATELQNVLLASGLFPELDQQLRDSDIKLGGDFAFNGQVRGDLTNPLVDGRARVGSLLVQNRNLGALAAAISVTPDEVRVSDGRLEETDGGGAQFTLVAPRTGINNIALDVTLDRANAGNLLAAIDALRPRVSTDASQQGTLDRLNTLQADLSGRVNVTGLPDAMSGSADLRLGAGRIAGEPFESVIARATFNGPVVNLETVDARFNAGRITASGTYNTTTQGFDIQARGTDIHLDRLETLAKDARGVPRLTGTADLTAHATGTLTEFSTYQINIDGEGRDVTVNGRSTGRLTLVGRTENKQFDLRLTTDLLGQPQVIAARVDLSSDRLPTTVETTLTGADLTPLFALMLPQSNVKVMGRATGQLRASGNLVTKDDDGVDSLGLAGLSGTANFTELTVQIEEIELRAVSPLLVTFSPEEVEFNKTQFTGDGTNVLVGGTAALGPKGRQNLTVDGRLNLRVLNSLSPNIFLAGVAEASVRVTGSYEQPRIFGTATLAGASIASLIGDERLTLSNVNGRVRFNSNQAQIDTLTGNLGGGRVTVSGGALLAGLRPSSFRFSVRGEDVTVPYPEGFRTTADADLEINGTRRGQIVTGVVNLRRAEYMQDIELADLINRRREASLTEGGGDSTFAATTQLDLRIEGRDALVVRNNLADIVGSVSVRAVGAVEDPVISGRVSVTRGTLNFRNDRYEVTRGFIDLPAARDADPLLNIQAEAEIKGYQVLVGLTGPLSQPVTTLRSDPALPQADVVALVLTGNLSTGETGGSTLAQTGLGTATSLLTDTLINAPVRRATDKLFGLNRFELEPLIAGRGGASPTARLTVGRQINRDLSVTYSTNLTSDQNQVLAVEYRVSNRLSFVAQYEQGSVTDFGSRNDNFSFEIRFRKRF
ncbi:MAG: translocation/assembly module TamB domain-containing protein [Pyrinomonadaceae bacterium]